MNLGDSTKGIPIEVHCTQVVARELADVGRGTIAAMAKTTFEVIQEYPDHVPEPFGDVVIDVHTPLKAGDAVMLNWSDGSDAYVVKVLRVAGTRLHVTAWSDDD